ncbi:MAG: DUF924 family protein [Pseudomonadota bacterium]
MANKTTTPDDVLNFWFEQHGQSDWWQSSDAFDEKVRDQFGDTLEAAGAGELSAWRDTPHGRLAEIIVLDQFSRQIHRGSGQAYAYDAQARALAQEAVRQGDHEKLTTEQRHFMLMPYMHAESLVVHDEGLPLFEALENEQALKFSQGHRSVVERFGRYPTRNAVLGRANTPQEAAYLAERDLDGGTPV